MSTIEITGILEKAGKILRFLKINYACSIEMLKDEFEMTDKEIFVALGLLACEYNMIFYKKEGIQYVFLLYL